LKRITYKEAAKKAIEELEKLNQGNGKRITVCVMLFFRRYWENRSSVLCKWIAAIDATHLPIVLLEVEKYLPTGLPP
jgi:leucyl-tRNA synthetase